MNKNSEVISYYSGVMACCNYNYVRYKGSQKQQAL